MVVPGLAAVLAMCVGALATAAVNDPRTWQAIAVLAVLVVPGAVAVVALPEARSQRC